ncbi:MAG: manganese efflux pump [Bacillota bacterium]|nr:manganese efflux pump [Bacillota bacterium]
MTLYTLFFIALALSLDAFGVALSIGLNNHVKFRNKIQFIVSFGFFQFLFSIIGAYSGFLFNTYIASVPQVIGGGIISVVGVLMIKEGMEDKRENLLVDSKIYALLGISVSIDALVVGFTAFSSINSSASIFANTIFVGIVTIVMSSLAFFISMYLKRIAMVSKYADYVGGVILIIFGIKMMFL